MAYAQGTDVSVERTQTELTALLRKQGASSVAVGFTADAGVIQFESHERQIRFTVPMLASDADELRFTKQRQRRTPSQMQSAHAAEERRRWRALLLVVKAKFEAVESGIVTFESEFLAQVVLPDGHTVHEHVEPTIARAYIEGHVRPLLQIGDGS